MNEIITPRLQKDSIDYIDCKSMFYSHMMEIGTIQFITTRKSMARIITTISNSRGQSVLILSKDILKAINKFKDSKPIKTGLKIKRKYI